MSLFSPPRYQSPYKPVSRENISLLMALFTNFEAGVKGLLFGCMMCGNCILQETAFICPMTCPKGMRNGLCGGATPEACEVDPSRPCTWYLIYQRAERMGRMGKLLEINAPLDGERIGKETWLDLVRMYRNSKQKPNPVDYFRNKKKFQKDWDAFFYKVRQPEWWQGDADYHPPADEKPVSLLDANLREGHFVVTSEVAPPLGVSHGRLTEKLDLLQGIVTAVNFTDNSAATPRMSSVATSRLCLDHGMEPVMQLQARDRSRLVIEADAIGAAGLGIRNILCITGDHFRFGPKPIAYPHQFDLDSIQMLWMLRRMRDEGSTLDGRMLKQKPKWFLGAVSNPFGTTPKYEAIRVEKKVNAGAQFIQTQPVFDVDRFEAWLEYLDKRNVLGKVYILAGVIPLKSAKIAHYMAENIPGVVIPNSILERMDQAAGTGCEKQTGVDIAVSLIEKIRHMPAISGLHLMAIHWESIVPELIDKAGLPKPLVNQLNE